MSFFSSLPIKQQPPESKRNRFYQAIKVCIAIGLLVWLVVSGRIDFEALFHVKKAIPAYIVCFSLLGVGWLIQIYRWKLITNSLGISISFAEACRMTWISQFCGLFLPGVAAGELVRGYLVAGKVPISKLLAASTVLIDRAFGLYTLLWLGMVSSSLLLIGGPRETEHQVLIISLTSGGFICGLQLIWFIATHRNNSRFIKKIIQMRYFEKYVDMTFVGKIKRKEITSGILLSFFSSFLSILAFCIIGKTVSPGTGWLPFFILCPIVFISLILPISPGGIGVGEATAAFIFSIFNIQNGASMMLLYRVINMILRLPGAFLFCCNKREKKKK